MEQGIYTYHIPLTSIGTRVIQNMAQLEHALRSAFLCNALTIPYLLSCAILRTTKNITYPVTVSKDGVFLICEELAHEENSKNHSRSYNYTHKIINPDNVQ
jgi:hypothetical protein